MKHVSILFGITILTLSSSCGDNSSVKQGGYIAAESNAEAKRTVNLKLNLPKLSGEYDADTLFQDNINAFELSYKSTNDCDTNIDSNRSSIYKSDTKLSLDLDPSCDYEVFLAAGWNNNLKASSVENSSTRYIDINLSEANPNYTDDIKPLLESNCTSCHGGNSPSAGIDLTTYEKAKQYSNGSLRSLTASVNSMPPRGKLSDDKIILFKVWVEQGTKESSNNDEVVENTPPKTSSPLVKHLDKVYFQSDILLIEKSNFDRKTKVEVNNITLKLTSEGKTAGFKSPEVK